MAAAVETNVKHEVQGELIWPDEPTNDPELVKILTAIPSGFVDIDTKDLLIIICSHPLAQKVIEESSTEGKFKTQIGKEIVYIKFENIGCWPSNIYKSFKTGLLPFRIEVMDIKKANHSDIKGTPIITLANSILDKWENH